MSRTPVPTTSDAQVGASHARLVRGVAAGALATFVALFSHVAAGGHAPVLPGVVLPLVLAVFVSVVLAGRRLSLLRLSASVTVSQSAFHWIFSAAAASSPGAGRASAARATADAVAAGDPHAFHHGAGVPADFAATVGSGAAGAAGSAGAADVASTAGGHALHAAGHDSPLMLVAHVIAAVVTIVALHRSELILHSLLRLLRLVRSLLGPLLRVPAPVVSTSRRRLLGAGCAVVSPAPLGVVRSARVDRGPPARVPAVA
ncbi:hypothetical protein [Brevibacterium senegalense]|uniref:hypothetical protein n=1 Tax=Brevibacterium senegalense TaxID=1033736 RepID=UPI000312AC16|nr:hypothetical protein [Brevibacterium senegalense]